jgi:hypothetical protein
VRIHRLCRASGEAQRSQSMRLTAASYSAGYLSCWSVGVGTSYRRTLSCFRQI